MTEIIVACILAGVPAVVTLITFLKTRQQVENGLKSVISEVHSDMQLTVLPTLADLKSWRDGYRGTIWSDKDAIEAWLEELAGQFGSVDQAIAAVKQDLHSHVEWEEQEKYQELERQMEMIADERHAKEEGQEVVELQGEESSGDGGSSDG